MRTRNTLCVFVSALLAPMGYAQWQVVQTLDRRDLPATGSGRLAFGELLDRDGDALIVSSTGDGTMGTNAGSASIFCKDVSGQWALEATLYASDAQEGDLFGPCAIAGDRAAVFTVFRSPISSGHFFERQPDGQWVETHKFDTTPYDIAGFWVDMDERWVVAGTLGTADAGEVTGVVLTYRLEGDQWVEGPVVRSPDATEPDGFGTTAVLGGGYLYVGAPGNDEGGSNAGAVYIYREDGDRWLFEQKIIGPREAAGIGATLAADGTTLAMGALCSGCRFPGEGPFSAYAAERADGRWSIVAELPPHADLLAEDWYGTGVAIDGDRIIVGAQNAGDATAGAVYEFRRTDAWRPRSVIPSPIAEQREDFGVGMALEGDEMVVGAPHFSVLPSVGGRVHSFTYCAADFDSDGELTIFDYLEFQNIFDAMDPAADLDGDGRFTVFDFLAFQNAFDLGCP